jgi:hypothetical protein
MKKEHNDVRFGIMRWERGDWFGTCIFPPTRQEIGVGVLGTDPPFDAQHRLFDDIVATYENRAAEFAAALSDLLEDHADDVGLAGHLHSTRLLQHVELETLWLRDDTADLYFALREGWPDAILKLCIDRHKVIEGQLDD